MSFYLNKRYAFLALFLFHAASIILAPTFAMDDPEPLPAHTTSRPSTAPHSFSLSCGFDFFHKGEFTKALAVFSELIQKGGALIPCAYVNYIYQHKLAPIPEGLLECIAGISSSLKKPGKEFLKISLSYRNYEQANTNKAQETHLRELDSMRRNGHGYALAILDSILDKSTGTRMRFINNLYKAMDQTVPLLFETCLTPDIIEVLFNKIPVNPLFKQALKCFLVNYKKAKDKPNNPYLIADLAMQIYALSPEKYKDSRGIPFPENTKYPERNYWSLLAFQNGSMKAYLPYAEFYLEYPRVTYNNFLEVNYFISRFQNDFVEKNGKDTLRLKAIIAKYKKIADTSNAVAQAPYGLLCYESGDWEGAFKYSQMAADRGDATAQYNYAVMLYEQGGPENYVKAREYFKKSADRGNATAQYNYAVMTEKNGSPEDFKEVQRYYKKAADQGIAEAQLWYGILMMKEENTQQALVYYKMAANQGLITASENHTSLSVMLFSTKQTEEKLKRAAEGGSPVMKCNYGMICYKKNNFKEAYEFFMVAADQGLFMAQYYLGIMYYYGKGVSQDFAKAHEYFNKAAGQGHLTSNLFLYSLANRDKTSKESFDSQAKSIEEPPLEKDDILEIPIPLHAATESLVPPPEDEENGVMSFIEKLTEEELKLQEEISQFNQQNEQAWTSNQQQKKLQKEAKREAAARTVCTLIIKKKDYDEVLKREELQMERQLDREKMEVKELTMRLVESIFGIKGAQKINSFTDQDAAQAFVNLGCVVNSAHGENSTLLSFDLEGDRMIKMKYHNPHGHGDHKLYNAMKPHFKKFLTLINKTPGMLEVR